MANHINVNVDLDMSGIKSRVLASGVALFFAFLVIKN